MSGQEMRGHLDPADVNREIQFGRRVGAEIRNEDPFLVQSIATRIRLYQVADRQRDLLDRVEESLTDGDDEPDPSRHPAFPYEMSHDVAADTGLTEPNEVTRTLSTRFPVQLDGIVLGAATGAKNAVGVRLTTDDGDRLVPRNFEDDYMGIPGGFSDTFHLRYRLDPGEDLVAETVNLDAAESHFITIIPQGVVLPEPVPEDDESGAPDEPGEPGGDR